MIDQGLIRRSLGGNAAVFLPPGEQPEDTKATGKETESAR